MNVDRRTTMCLCDLFIIYLTEPVVCGHGSGVAQNKSSETVCDSTVFLHTPVIYPEVVIHQLLVVEQRARGVASVLMLLSI